MTLFGARCGGVNLANIYIVISSVLSLALLHLARDRDPRWMRHCHCVWGNCHRYMHCEAAGQQHISGVQKLPKMDCSGT